MATIKFILQSKKNPANIYLRYSIDRDNVFKRKTPYIVNPDNWSDVNGGSKSTIKDAELKKEMDKLNESLTNLKNGIIKNYNNDCLNEVIDGNWLQKQIDTLCNKKEKKQINNIVDIFQSYIEYLPFKLYVKNGKKVKGVEENTIKKYRALKSKISDYQKYKKKTFQVKDVNLSFVADFESYLKNIDKLNDNTIGRYIIGVKTVCKYAKKILSLEVSSNLDQIEGYSEEVKPIYLTFDELDKIDKTIYKTESLQNSKDWLIIGCYIGQRVSDLLTLTKSNIKKVNGLEVIEIEQVKTKKKVSIAIPPQVCEILNKRDGNFPRKISDVKFNKYIKDVCEIAGINQIIEGGKIDEETKRKVKGNFPKWQLIGSHVCRRSFATNFYTDIPTSLLINITGHSTEKQFLEYIGKTSPDFLDQQNYYWTMLTNKRIEDNKKIRRLG